jgi:hypothetical protein
MISSTNKELWSVKTGFRMNLLLTKMELKIRTINSNNWLTKIELSVKWPSKLLEWVEWVGRVHILEEMEDHQWDRLLQSSLLKLTGCSTSRRWIPILLLLNNMWMTMEMLVDLQLSLMHLCSVLNKNNSRLRLKAEDHLSMVKRAEKSPQNWRVDLRFQELLVKENLVIQTSTLH